MTVQARRKDQAAKEGETNRNEHRSHAKGGISFM